MNQMKLINKDKFILKTPRPLWERPGEGKFAIISPFEKGGWRGIFPVLYALIFFSLFSSLLFSAPNNAGTTGASFLRIPLGARPSAMGESFTAVGEDSNSLWWNAAGLAEVQKEELSFMHNEWLEGVRQEYIAYVHPDGKQGFGGGINILHSTLKRTLKGLDSNGIPYPVYSGEFSVVDTLVQFGYGYSFSKTLSLGAALKYISQTNADVNGTALGLDMSALYKLKTLSFGLNIQNVGQDITLDEESFSLPMNFKLGAAWRPIKLMLLTADYNQPIDNQPSVNAGFEYRPIYSFCLRAGYKYQAANTLGALSALRAGFGLKFNKFKIDYAFLPYGDLGIAHNLSLTYSF